jgi:hypothetical protein
MLWKELHYEQDTYLLLPGAWRREDKFVAALVVAVLLGFYLCLLAVGGGPFIDGMNLLGRTMGAILCPLVLLVVPLRTARAVSRERERRTLDNLLTTPLGREEILSAKVLGSVASISFFWWGVLFCLTAGVLLGCLHVLAGLVLAVACATYAGVLALVGLWASATSGTTLQATVRALLATFLLGAGPWLLSVYGSHLPASLLSAGSGAWAERLLRYGLTPPLTLYVLGFGYGDFLAASGPSTRENVQAALIGLLCHMLLGLLLWRRTLARF